MIGSAFLINAMIDFIILVLLFYIISILNKKDISMRNKFSILSFFYFISLILNIALLSGKLTAVSSEILLIESFFMIGKTFVFVLIFSEILKNKKLMYYLGLYILAVATFKFGFDDFFSLLNIISNILLLIVFIYTHHRKDKYLRRSAFFGMLYCVVSFILIFFLNDKRDLLSIVFLIPNVFLFGTFYYFSKYLVMEEVDFYKKPKRYEIPLYAKFMVGLRLLSIVFMTFIFIMVSVVSFHELGHALAGKHFGCRISKAVLYDGVNLPHTEVVCADDSNNILIGSAGLFIPLILGLVFLLLGERSTLGVSYLIIGFSFYLSSKDLQDILPSNAIAMVISLIGVMFLILGIKEVLYYAYDEENLKHSLS